MAGHSKWENIKRKKAVVDAKRGKEFTKLSKNITVAARQGGTDPDTNASLRLAIQKAKDANMPKDKIEKAIKKVEAGAEGMEEVGYEFYGPGGVAVIVNCLTDNKNRTAAEVKTVIGKNGYSLGAQGSAGYIFNGGEPTFKTPLSDKDSESLQKVLDDLEELDDVTDIVHNAE
jgi:YebC/PmpR family DNA-binding regulatory protein